MIGRIFVDVGEEVGPEDVPGVDLRTREGREAEVVAQVNAFGGFTVFWVTECQQRACAADRLIKRGVMASGRTERPFPWCSHVIVGSIGGAK